MPTTPPDGSSSTPDRSTITWGMVRQAANRPYRVTLPMIVLISLVPGYLVLAARARGRIVHVPAVTWDSLFPLIPTWALVYGALYAFLILLPVFVLQEDEMIRRTVWAYLTVWAVSYAVFLAYPTVAPRPDAVPGRGFAVWGLRFLYGADPPYNCFPSLHVAHSFVSGFACYRVHRSLGFVALASAVIVGLSTLFTRQHYLADVVAGALLAFLAYAIFLRPYPDWRTPELQRRLAPILSLWAGGIVALGIALLWVAYRLLGWA
jgi:membrane-associated phospholipid phosphatase